jgi:hypothetical protein
MYLLTVRGHRAYTRGMSFLVHALEVLVVLGMLAALAAGSAFLVARRMVRRRWRNVRDHVATRGALSALSLVGAGKERFVARARPEDVCRGTAARTRRRMWIAVGDAEDAVRHADARDAPVAELPAVCRSLRSLAADMDQLLRLERRLPLGADRPLPVRVQVAELIRASRDVQMAALRACSDATEPQIRSLVRRSSEEVEIVAEALSRMRTVAPHPR